jgi:hypothetical protein
MREEEGAPKPDMCSPDRTDGEPKGGSGSAHLFDVSVKLGAEFVRIVTELSDIGVNVGRRSKRKRIYSPPGALARSITSFLFPKKAFDEIFAQAINDMREEHAESLASGSLWKARWIVIRDHFGLCLTVGAYLSATVIKKAAGIFKIIP